MPDHNRQLAVIMFTDIAGYTSLMGEDENLAISLLKANRSIHKKCIAHYNGKWLKEMGDGVLASFSSVSDAVYCACALQREAGKIPLLQLSIGIHLGEVIFEVGDVFGDGVNIASRIESIAPPGSIYVSGSVNSNLTNKKGITSEFVTEEVLKNVKDPIKIYKVSIDPQDQSTPEDIIISESLGKSRSRHRRYKKPYLLSLGILVIIAMAFFIFKFFAGNASQAGTGSELKSIVVLPFENLGQEEDEYFANGITEEITSRLGLINGLSIISPLSAKQYKNKNKTIAEIAKELNVDYVLGGSIRWDKSGETERVRITTSLNNASSNRQVWGDNIERELNEIFEVQSEIAEKVANALDVTLIASEQNGIGEKPTNNLEAYDFYLRGQNYINLGRSERNSSVAEQMFQRAIQLDPGFALAYASLSRVNMEFWWFSWDRDTSRISQAKYYLEKAQAINNDLPEIQLALGIYYYHGFLDYEKSLEHLLLGLKLKPGDPLLLSYTGYVKRRQGDLHEAINYFKKAIKIDPLSAEAFQSLSETLMLVRNYEEARKNNERVISILPEWTLAYHFNALLTILETGNIEGALNILEASLDVASDENDITRYGIITYLIYKGSYDKALDHLNSLRFSNMEDTDYYISKYQLYAEIWSLKKNTELLKVYADSALQHLEEQLKIVPDDPRIYSSVGITSALKGEKEAAIQAAKKAAELLPVSKDAWRGYLRQVDLARVYCLTGEYDKALEKLDFLLSIPGELSVSLIGADSKFNALRNLPGYQQLINKYQ